jgi:hypothetical protein
MAGSVTRAMTLPYQVPSNSSIMYHPDILYRRDQCFQAGGTSTLSGTRDTYAGT